MSTCLRAVVRGVCRPLPEVARDGGRWSHSQQFSKSLARYSRLPISTAHGIFPFVRLDPGLEFECPARAGHRRPGLDPDLPATASHVVALRHHGSGGVWLAWVNAVESLEGVRHLHPDVVDPYLTART